MATRTSTELFPLGRRRTGLGFAATALIAPALAWWLPDRPRVSLVVAAFALTLLAIGLVSLGAVSGGNVVTGAGIVVYAVAVALLRESEGGAQSAYAPLLLLPVFWTALFGGPRLLALSIVALATALAAPIIILGAPSYPASEWRRFLIWLVVAPVLAATTQELVRSVQRSREEAAAIAVTDALTGLLNRHGFANAAARETSRARRTGGPLTLAIFDIDRFKRFNDTHGHEAGDHLLRQAAGRWLEELRDTDVLARWGGEEFVVLLPDTPVDTAVGALERARRTTPSGQTCSLGVTLWMPDEELGVALARADVGLYRAKSAGRDRIVVMPAPGAGSADAASSSLGPGIR